MRQRCLDCLGSLGAGSKPVTPGCDGCKKAETTERCYLGVLTSRRMASTTATPTTQTTRQVPSTKAAMDKAFFGGGVWLMPFLARSVLRYC